MKYGQISPAPRMNAVIYKCFEFIPEEDARKFVKKFGDQPHDGQQIMHTVRELVVGAFVGSKGLLAHYDPLIDNQTPDWLLEPDIIVELTNFHAPQTVHDSVQKQLTERSVASYWAPPNTDRLYQSIWDKASIYKSLVEARSNPYVIAFFADFKVEIDQDELQQCLSGEDSLFQMYPSVSGVVHFIERSGVYYFQYHPNPQAERPFQFPSGILDLADLS